MLNENSQKQKELEEKLKKEQLLKEYFEKQKANQLKEEKRSKN